MSDATMKFCEECGRGFAALKANATYCSGRCRQQGYRSRVKATEELLELERRKLVAERVMVGGFRVTVEPAPPGLLEGIRR